MLTIIAIASVQYKLFLHSSEKNANSQKNIPFYETETYHSHSFVFVVVCNKKKTSESYIIQEDVVVGTFYFLKYYIYLYYFACISFVFDINNNFKI